MSTALALSWDYGLLGAFIVFVLCYDTLRSSVPHLSSGAESAGWRLNRPNGLAVLPKPPNYQDTDRSTVKPPSWAASVPSDIVSAGGCRSMRRGRRDALVLLGLLLLLRSTVFLPYFHRSVVLIESGRKTLDSLGEYCRRHDEQRDARWRCPSWSTTPHKRRRHRNGRGHKRDCGGRDRFPWTWRCDQRRGILQAPRTRSADLVGDTEG